MNNVNNLIKNIKEIISDYTQNYKTNFDLNEIIEYILLILKELYEPKIYKKYIYIEIIKQIVSNLLNELNTCYNFNISDDKFIMEQKNNFKIVSNKHQVKQRSEEWYNNRNNKIGASELSSVFNKNPFCSRKKFIKKKCVKNINESFHVNKYCLHGIKYEDIIIKIYEQKNNVIIDEFGSIKHNYLDFIAASPDGITNPFKSKNKNYNIPIMLEIKAPFVRKIFGIPPIYYWYQMQQQMEVCNINACDFLECKIEEYSNWNEYINDNYNNDYSKNNLNMEKGVIIEYLNYDESGNTFGYIYPDKLYMTLNEIKLWKNNQIKYLENNNKKYIRLITWKLIFYSCFRVYRNVTWWKNNINKIKNTWEEILLCKKNNIDSDIKNIKKSKKKKKIISYEFINEDEIT